MVKHLPAMQETWVQSLGWEDLEKEIATHSSILAWRFPRMEEPGRLQSMGSQRVRHDWATSLHDYLSLWIFIRPLRTKKFTLNYVNNSHNLQWIMFQSIQLSHSIMSDSATPWTEHIRHPCPSPTPGACSNSCPLNWWCHPTISFSVVPFSSCLQSFWASGSFPKSQFFTSGGQSNGLSASASVSPSNEYSGLISFRMDWLDL